MARYPDFIAAQREKVPNYTQAAIYQGAGDLAADKFNQERKEQQLRAPIDAYEGYVNLSEHNPLADAVRKWSGKGGEAGGGTASSAASVGADPLASGVGNAASPAIDSAAMPAAQSMTPGGSASLINAGTTPVATEAATKGATMGANLGSAAVPVVGGLLNAGIKSTDPNASTGDVALAGASGASTGALMTAAPALAAAGPVGWAGIAGLAALSLYGMLA